jgi:hypothetical protein
MGGSAKQKTSILQVYGREYAHFANVLAEVHISV